MSTATLSSVEERSELYGLLAELFSFPTEQMAEAIATTVLASTMHMLGAEVMDHDAIPMDGLAVDVTFPELQGEYIRLFDLPGGGPACPLYTGVYAKLRREAMEELLRFYRYFGLTLASGRHDLPDSAPTVLEFLAFLVEREAMDGAGARLAQRDILARHVVPWLTQTIARLPKRAPQPFYPAVFAFALAFCRTELAELSD